MKGWVKGLLIGGGIAAACTAVALLLRREEQRRFLQERYQQWRSTLPGREQAHQYTRQAAARVSQYAGTAKGVVRQMMDRVKPAGSGRGVKVQQLAPAGN